jgi:hypothetical protein
MIFDIRGNLTETVEMTLADFRETFVEKWDSEGSTRAVIFKDFEKYIADFKTELVPSFEIWIDGSFVCIKRDNPNDLDFVVILESDIFDTNANIIEARFGKNRNKIVHYPRLDAYILQNFPSNHKNAFFTISDKAYWSDLFNNTKPDREKRKYKKGFVKLKFYEI